MEGVWDEIWRPTSPKMVPKPSQTGAKLDVKSIQHLLKIDSEFLLEFLYFWGLIFHCFLVPKSLICGYLFDENLSGANM